MANVTGTAAAEVTARVLSFDVDQTLREALPQDSNMNELHDDWISIAGYASIALSVLTLIALFTM